ncbi:hypothetical protein DM01DRAFT_200921 [Hesseltinella vesiculosa]|uniref:Uncharacterized protein n=1 Tax=Hesseltinella vesiculosa TaxID=101127 RepID=A0A1X2GD05_9FUNG|nr:hypothetical protein DM01DRAFT_200921 [Hesseltinella vesiculosa]
MPWRHSWTLYATCNAAANPMLRMAHPDPDQCKIPHQISITLIALDARCGYVCRISQCRHHQNCVKTTRHGQQTVGILGAAKVAAIDRLNRRAQGRLARALMRTVNTSALFDTDWRPSLTEAAQILSQLVSVANKPISGQRKTTYSDSTRLHFWPGASIQMSTLG